MRLMIIAGLAGLLVSGCGTLPSEIQRNPFREFTAADVDRVSICFEEAIWGTEGSKTYDPDDRSVDSVWPVEFYLKPSGFAIRDRETITQLHKALRSSKIGTGYPKTASGILSYQVFLDKKNRVLAVTSIENYQCNISISDCSLEKGWIRFEEDMSFRGCQNVPFCRTVYEFMKKELPDIIASWEESFKKHGGLEKHLFGGVE